MFESTLILQLIWIFPIITYFFILNDKPIFGFGTRTIALLSSVLQVILCVYLIYLELYYGPFSTFKSPLDTIKLVFFSFLSFNVDSFSLWMVFLTLFIQFICVVQLNFTVLLKAHYKFISLIIYSTTFILVNFFFAADLLTLYVWFEAILIPFFIYIGTFGPSQQRVTAAYYFFFYTFIGSLPMLATVVYLSITYGTTNLELLSQIEFSLFETKVLFFLTFLTIMVKIPCYPFHIWLPRAHVEAPTLGSIILAALLLKTGSFAIIRVLLPL
jgi:NADH-quinone oxidoreductase subunit M